jgi:hypothetical protein
MLCFGGTFVNNTISDKLYSLDLDNLTISDGTFTSINQASQQWVEVTPINSANYIIEPRTKAASIVYGNNTLLIYGGYTFNGAKKLTNQTIAYYYDTNSWGTLPSYYSTPNETKQMFVYKLSQS